MCSPTTLFAAVHDFLASAEGLCLITAVYNSNSLLGPCCVAGRVLAIVRGSLPITSWRITCYHMMHENDASSSRVVMGSTTVMSPKHPWDCVRPWDCVLPGTASWDCLHPWDYLPVSQMHPWDYLPVSQKHPWDYLPVWTVCRGPGVPLWGATPPTLCWRSLPASPSAPPR